MRAGPASRAGASFSPVLIAGLALRALPLPPLQALLQVGVSGLRRSHPRIFERFREFDDVLVAIYPTDLPFGFTLRLGGDSVFAARVHDHDSMPPKPTATIRGSFALLLRLLEGTIDGDAVFFSRDFSFEGDTEVILRLRNMLESEEIDLPNDLLRGLGLPGPVARRCANHARRLGEMADRDLRALQEALVGPLRVRQEALGAAVADLRGEVDRLRRDLRRARGSAGGVKRVHDLTESTGAGPGT
jgi:predicted lipid carrier protein YhbT